MSMCGEPVLTFMLQLIWVLYKPIVHYIGKARRRAFPALVIYG